MGDYFADMDYAYDMGYADGSGGAMKADGGGEGGFMDGGMDVGCLENSKDGRIDVFQKTIWLLKDPVKWTNKQPG